MKPSGVEKIARHFAQWGAEHSGSSEITNDLEEAAYKYSFDSRPSIYGQVDVIDAFKVGAKWQKEQMMKGAVEGVVHHYADVHYIVTNQEHLSDRLKVFDKDTKVKIIIIKEDEK